jgi:DNA-binding transcriptional regulator YiaG
MDVQKTIEFLLQTQARHDGQIAEMREAQKLSHAQHSSEIAEIREAQKLSHAQHASEITEIRDLLGRTVKLVAA